MYYKVINKDSQIYKDLYKMREEELQAEESNRKYIEETVKHSFTHFLGNLGQQNFYRVSIYEGFKFDKPDELCLKTWSESKQYPGYFIPNKRTKLGREIKSKLSSNIKHFWVDRVFDILKVEKLDRFTFPFIEICGEVIIIFIQPQEVENPDVVEITKKEFTEIREQFLQNLLESGK